VKRQYRDCSLAACHQPFDVVMNCGSRCMDGCGVSLLHCIAQPAADELSLPTYAFFISSTRKLNIINICYFYFVSPIVLLNNTITHLFDTIIIIDNMTATALSPSSPNNTRAVAVSMAISLSACLLWIATTTTSNHNDGDSITPLLDGDAYMHRRLYSILAEDHKVPELFPFEPTDYVGFVAMILGLILAAGAGIGGGGLLVPIFILVFGFCIKHAIPLASVTVLGGAIANNLLNANKCHPNHPSRPAIDWDLILQLEPMTIAGALIGADLNDVLPPQVLVVLLFLLLSLTAYKTLQKACKLHQQESEAFLKGEELDGLIKSPDGTASTSSCNNSVDDVERSHIYYNGNGAETKYGSVSATSNGHAVVLNAQPSFGPDQVQQAFVSASKLTALFAVVTILNLLKGGPGEDGGGPAGLPQCGPKCFWMTEVFIFVLIIAFAYWTRRTILKRMEEGGPALSEIEWNEHNTLVYPLYANVAGLVAGMFGVGGGIIKGPLMLALGTCQVAH